jgi:thioredoxin-dependent peroxiredoxin
MLQPSFLRKLFAFALAVLSSDVLIAQNTPPKDFTVESPTHKESFTLSKAKGKTVVLHFLLKTECPLCLRYTQTYAKQSKDRSDVVHVFLKPDSVAEIKKWASHLDAKSLKKSPVIYRDADAKLAEAYAIPDGYAFHGETVHYPATVVLNEQGEEVFRYVGKSNADRLSYEDFEKQLAAKAK